MDADIRDFGHMPDGRLVRAVTIASAHLSATILTWGAALNDVRLAGIDRGLTLGGPRIAAYVGPMGYFGTLVGPVANRIAGARAVIAGTEHAFEPNEGTTLLHGGRTGTQARHWALEAADTGSLRLALVLEDGAGGFPGRRRLRADFAVAGMALTLRLEAETDAPTLMNLANHSYWNLDGTPTIAGHRLRIAADAYLPVTDRLLPTGEQRPVSGAFDLRAGRALDLSEGFDHNFCLAPTPRGLTEVADLTGTSGVTLRLATTEPGLQVYDGRRLDSAPFAGHGGQPYGPFAGLALEPQRWPDAPQHPAFPPITLAPGETYRQETRWSFAA
jgi:aldose 1-epimerase